MTVAVISVAVTVAAVIVAIAMAALVATEGTIVAIMVAAVVALRLMRVRLQGGLRQVVVAHVVAVVLPELLGAFTGLAQPTHALAIAVHAIARLIELLAIRHDDAAVVLGMLQIVLCQHRIARRLGVARERDVFFRYVRRGAADFHVRTIGFKAPRKRIVVAAFAIAVAAASAAVLLSLPHWPLGSRLT